jgi:exodeoxyribonuclease-5
MVCHEMDFSQDQVRALDGIECWRYEIPSQELTLGGFAGTGKTTIISYLADQWPGVAVAALCGKAANVLRSKGVSAQTIHSLIYCPYEDAYGKVRFRRKEKLENVNTIIIDEASMVDHLIHQDLLSFDKPVLFVGDHGQLEPIGTNPGLMEAPDYRLEEIHRQAQGNPIIRLSSCFREGKDVPYGASRDGRLRVVPKSSFQSFLSANAQFICGFNKTRHEVNRRIRQLRGLTSKHPEPGETLICLRNNKRFGLFNGQQVKCLWVHKVRKRTLEMEIEAEDGTVATVTCLARQFGSDVDKEHRDENVLLLDYGYCLTAHKSQGSEWDSVVVLEEVASLWDPKRWRYTVATRAKERLVYCG